MGRTGVGDAERASGVKVMTEQDNAPAQPPDVGRNKPKRPFEAAGRVVVRTRLENIRFSAFTAQTSSATEFVELSDEAVFSAMTRFLRPTVIRDGDATKGFTAKSTFLFKLSAGQAGAEAQTYATVSATLEGSYAFKKNAPHFTDEELQDFSLCYFPFHVWGYWREFVQSSLGRLDMPPFTLPLFQIDMAPKLVRDALE